MDERVDRQAALTAIDNHCSDIRHYCQETVEMLDVLEELNIITLDEKDNANADGDYSSVIPKLKEKIKSNPHLFTTLCQLMTQNSELSRLGKDLGGKLYKLLLFASNVSGTHSLTHPLNTDKMKLWLNIISGDRLSQSY